MCLDFFSLFFSEPCDPAANRRTHYKSCCVHTDLGSEQNHWCHDLCWSLRFLILPGIWRQIKKKHIIISMLLLLSLIMCVFRRVILVVLWCVRVQGSGLWWALCLGKEALVTPVSLQSMPASPSCALGSTGLFLPTRSPVWIFIFCLWFPVGGLFVYGFGSVNDFMRKSVTLYCFPVSAVQIMKMFQ